MNPLFFLLIFIIFTIIKVHNMKTELEKSTMKRRFVSLRRKRTVRNIKTIIKALWLPAFIIAITLFFASCNKEMRTVHRNYSPAQRYADKHGKNEFVSWEKTVKKYKRAQK
jgi:hypothetical protein